MYFKNEKKAKYVNNYNDYIVRIRESTHLDLKKLHTNKN